MLFRSVRVRTSEPSETRHNLMVPSPLPDASKLPSGENDTLQTTPVCPVSVRTNAPSETRHNLMVISQLPDASKLPSGENDTLETPYVCPVRVRTREPSGNGLITQITHSPMSNIAKTDQTQAPYLRRDACAGVGVGGSVGA